MSFELTIFILSYTKKQLLNTKGMSFKNIKLKALNFTMHKFPSPLQKQTLNKDGNFPFPPHNLSCCFQAFPHLERDLAAVTKQKKDLHFNANCQSPENMK